MTHSAASPSPDRAEKEEQEEEENVPAETFSRATEKEDPNHYHQLLQHTRADALVTLAEHFLATCGEKSELRGLKGSERCHVMLHVDINTLRQYSGEDGAHQEHCHLDEKPWVSAQTARRLSCDASLVTVLEDENGKCSISGGGRERCRLPCDGHWMFGIKPAVSRAALNSEPWNLII